MKPATCFAGVWTVGMSLRYAPGRAWQGWSPGGRLDRVPVERLVVDVHPPVRLVERPAVAGAEDRAALARELRHPDEPVDGEAGAGVEAVLGVRVVAGVEEVPRPVVVAERM